MRADPSQLQNALAQWRRTFRLDAPPVWTAEGGVGDGDVVESPAEPEFAVASDPLDRIAAARDAMRRLVKDSMGGDPALLAAVDRIALTGTEAIAVLADSGSLALPDSSHDEALETIVAFDGSRPSFLIKGGAIDFSSSFNTDRWEARLRSHAARIAAVIACVGRVEAGDTSLGTAFLVTPTLAVTNRHVAQLMARFDEAGIRIRPGVSVDFGRESGDLASFDRRSIVGIAFVGPEPIVKPLNHARFDIAVLRLSPSTLDGQARDRCLSLGGVGRDAYDFADAVATVGYPGDPTDSVPAALRTEFAEVLRRLLEGGGDAKRFAPGRPAETAGLPPWTAAHDATTIGGNSGSPLLAIDFAATRPLTAAGLHYGGRWLGERTNWSHLLALAGDARGLGGVSFAAFCAAEGVALGA